MISFDVRRGATRYRDEHGGVVSRHAFAAGARYDPHNLRFGPLIGFDEHVLAPGAGFTAHRHREVEILTWPVAGVLTHRHADEVAALVPGTLQYLAAGVGVTHSETNEAATPARFLQMALSTPAGGRPRWERSTVVGAWAGRPPGGEALGGEALGDGPAGGWRALAAAAEPALVRLVTPGASLGLGRFDASARLHLADAPLRLLHVIRGQVRLDPPASRVGGLGAGDSVRITGAGSVAGRASEDAELLLWRFQR